MSIVQTSAALLNSPRATLRDLDRCLFELEEAHVAGGIEVTHTLTARLRPYIAEIRPGMLIAEGIELVFSEQEHYLSAEEDDDSAPDPVDAGRCEGAARVGDPG